MKTKIGLLGGIGPEATGIFYLQLIDNIQKSKMIKSNTDFPQIIINSIPAPELVSSSVSEKDLVDYINGLKELDAFGVDFIAMVCNTIHVYHSLLQSKIATPIINLKSEFNENISKKKIKSAVIIATPETIKNKIFEVDGIRYFRLNESEMGEISDAILNFNSGVERERQSQRVKKIAEKHIRKGAEVVILGCTEISLMLKDSGINNIDTMEVLSEAVIKWVKQSKS